jgi:hypothetical protein
MTLPAKDRSERLVSVRFGCHLLKCEFAFINTKGNTRWVAIEDEGSDEALVAFKRRRGPRDSVSEHRIARDPFNANNESVKLRLSLATGISPGSYQEIVTR